MSGQKQFYITFSISLWPVILYSATLMGMSYSVARWSARRFLETERRVDLAKGLGEKKIESDAVSAWDKLSTREILKKADPGLDRYFKKQDEYREAKSDLREKGDRGINTLVKGIQLSPFFDTQEERDSLLRMVERVKRQGVGFPCAELDEELKKISS